MLEEQDLSSKSVYSFVLWIATIVSYVIYLVWALVPDDTLQSLGFTYYPNRFYAVAIPAYLLVLYAVFCLAYHASCLMSTPSPEDMATVCDEHAVSPTQIVSNAGVNTSSSSTMTPPPVPHSHPVTSPPASTSGRSLGQIPDQYDLDARFVSKILAGTPRR